jgi:hypothetical protein
VATVTGASAANCKDLLVKPASGTAQTMVWQPDNSYSARIGIELAKGVKFASLERPVVFDVDLKDGQPNAAAGDFSAAFEPGTETSGAALIVTMLPTAKDRSPGTYAVTLQIKKKGAAPPQSLDLKLLRPTPALALGPAVYLELRRPLSSDSPTRKPGVLTVTETSGKGGLIGIDVRAEPDPKSWAAGSTGTLCFREKEIPKLAPEVDRAPPDPAASAPAKPPCRAVVAIDLAAYERRSLAVDSEGDFSPGSYSGKIDIRSAQLGTLSTVDFNLVSRRSQAWILVTVLLGVGLGWCARIFLQREQDAGQAKIAASLAMGKLASAYTEIEDPPTRAAIAEAIKTLEYSARYSAPADIAEAAKTALSTLVALQTSLKTVWDKLLDDVKQFTGLVTTPWELPNSVTVAFQELKTANADLANLVATKNATAAGGLLQALSTTSLPRTVCASIAWRESLSEYVNVLKEARPALWSKDQQTLNDFAQAVEKSLPAERRPPASDIAAASKDLSATHNVHVNTTRLFSNLVDVLHEFPETAFSHLGQSWDRTDPLCTAVEDATRLLVERLPRAESDFVGEIRLVEPLVRAQRDAWLNLLTRGMPSKQASQIRSLINGGNWEGALDEAAKSTADSGAVTTGDVDTLVASDFASPEMTTLQPFDFGAMPEAPVGKIPGVDLGPVLQGTESERRRLRCTIMKAAAIQSAIVAIAFLAGAYGMNEDTWIGTWKEIASLFLLAFGVDLTASGVVAALKR